MGQSQSTPASASRRDLARSQQDSRDVAPTTSTPLPASSANTPLRNRSSEPHSELSLHANGLGAAGPQVTRSFLRLPTLSRSARRPAPSQSLPSMATTVDSRTPTRTQAKRQWLSRSFRGKPSESGRSKEAHVSPTSSVEASGSGTQRTPRVRVESEATPDISTLAAIPDEDDSGPSAVSSSPPLSPIIIPSLHAEDSAPPTAPVDISATREQPEAPAATHTGSATTRPAPVPAPAPGTIAPVPPNRFPPAGTLVVVQGIVHTTDVPQPRQTTPLRTGPISSLRPPSVLGRRTGRSPSRNSYPGAGDAEPPIPTSAAPGEPPRTGDMSAPSAEELRDQLSRSNIEVLGTLLSVATAATAASLVTGSTDPLFQSGLAGPPPSTSGATPSSSSVPQDRGRVRSTFDSLLDRFRTGRRRAQDETENPRDLLIAEMARALNSSLAGGRSMPPPVAVGSPPDSMFAPRSAAQATNGPVPVSSAAEPANGDTVEGFQETATHAATLSSAPDAPAPATPVPVPPVDMRSPPVHDNSFERFLHNLQADLRVALTEDYAARRAATPTPTRPVSFAPTETSSFTFPPDPSLEPQQASEAPAAVVVGDPDLATTGMPLTEQRSVDMPAPTQQPPPGATTPGLNWWRLYRFPPMRVQAHEAPSTTSPSPSVPWRQNMPGEPSAAAAGSNSTTALPDATDAAQSTQIVPVIVVGLQSVSQEQLNGMLPAQLVAAAAAAATSAPPTLADNGDDALVDPARRERTWSRAARTLSRMGGLSSRRSDNASSSTPSSRPSTATAPSSTAPALAPPPAPPANTPAPAGATATPTPTRSSSSRTYLIYVIGGYYPPNHSIVTGGAEINSFEALWELAELLGQVKPPIATREEIARSGLEVLKAKDLSKYVDANTIASNTIERCLVCLDDYDDEDELRLMSCKHAFHKACVDRWLEQGRNNCPACRTKGVRTDGDTPPEMHPSEA